MTKCGTTVFVADGGTDFARVGPADGGGSIGSVPGHIEATEGIRMRMSSVVFDGSGGGVIGDGNGTNCGNAIAHGKALVGCGSRWKAHHQSQWYYYPSIVSATIIATDFKLEIVSGFGSGKGGKAEAAYGDIITGTRSSSSQQ